MTIAEFDHLDKEKKRELFLQCCGSLAWVNKMIEALPVEDLVDMLDTAEEKWFECSQKDWKEAFEHHPKIGDVTSLKQKSTAAKQLAENEQAGVNTAPNSTLQELSKYNSEYEDKFGYIFIVCAAGRSADEMLKDLKERLHNSSDEEIQIAATEQLKIIKLRLEKLFDINESTRTYEL